METKCCLCDYLGQTETDLERHIHANHKIFAESTDTDKTKIVETQQINKSTNQQITKQQIQLQKRKQEIETANVHKKIKLECAHCLKPYSNLKCLRTHTENKHLAEKNSLTICNRVLEVEIKQKETSNKFDTIVLTQNENTEKLSQDIDTIKLKEIENTANITTIMKELEYLKNKVVQLEDVNTKMNSMIQNEATINQNIKTINQDLNSFKINVSNDLTYFHKIEIAKIEQKQAQVIDNAKKNMLRLGGLSVFSNENKTLSAKEKIILNIQKNIQQITPHFKFKIINVRQLKKKNIHDVSFSECTNVAKLFSELENYFKDKADQFVTKMILPATLVRFSILKSIGKCIENFDKTAQCKVEFDGFQQPLLVISTNKNKQDEEQKKYKFADAVLRFQTFYRQNNFEEAKYLCEKYQLKGNLHQFIVL